jgi:hypothetical protein
MSHERTPAVTFVTHTSASLGHARRMRCERGQATIEWVGLVLLASVALGALAAAVPVADGRSFGGFLSHRILCAVRGTGCDDPELVRAYGERDAKLVRRYAPDLVYERGERMLPVDWRQCREARCAEAPDDGDLDSHRTNAGRPATAFTRVVRRHGRLYLQYWLYYPESNTAVLGSDRLWNSSPLRWTGRYPGFHPDDWEGYVVRIGRDGSAYVRASSHRHWQSCKSAACRNRWGRRTGWTRVSRGSHAGHIPVHGRPVPGPTLPGLHVRERTTTAEGMRLVPLETVDRGRYRPLDPGVRPPWRKKAYDDPTSGES